MSLLILAVFQTYVFGQDCGSRESFYETIRPAHRQTVIHIEICTGKYKKRLFIWVEGGRCILKYSGNIDSRWVNMSIILVYLWNQLCSISLYLSPSLSPFLSLSFYLSFYFNYICGSPWLLGPLFTQPVSASKVHFCLLLYTSDLCICMYNIHTHTQRITHTHTDTHTSNVNVRLQKPPRKIMTDV